MKNKFSLTEQLLYICILIVSIIVISLGLILPKTLIPIYEENLYNYLKQPLNILDNIENISSKINSEVAFIYLNENTDTVTITENLQTIVNINKLDNIIEKIDSKYGKFKQTGKTYYYYTVSSSNGKRIAITNDNYIQ